jgi:hypothetical protein
MKKEFEEKIEEHVLGNCVHVPGGFEFAVQNLSLFLRKNNEGKYIPGQVQYEVYCGEKKISTGYVHLTSV